VQSLITYVGQGLARPCRAEPVGRGWLPERCRTDWTGLGRGVEGSLNTAPARAVAVNLKPAPDRVWQGLARPHVRQSLSGGAAGTVRRVPDGLGRARPGGGPGRACRARLGAKSEHRTLNASCWQWQRTVSNLCSPLRVRAIAQPEPKAIDHVAQILSGKAAGTVPSEPDGMGRARPGGPAGRGGEGNLNTER
jgi:hypothetical protein